MMVALLLSPTEVLLFLLSLALTTKERTVAGKVYKFALCPKSTTNEYFRDANAGFLDGAAAINRSNVALGGPQVVPYYIGHPDFINDGIMQAQIVSEALEEMDGLAISVLDVDRMRPIIYEARRLGLPVVTFDSDDPESDRQSYIGTNNNFFGEQIGKVLDQIRPTGGRYAVISGATPNIKQRERGIVAALSAETWEKVAVTETKGNHTFAIEEMRRWAETIPDLTAIAVTSGGPMKQVDQWTRLVSDFPKITFVSGDDHEDALKHLKRNKVQGLVGQLPYDMGTLCVQSLLSLATEPERPISEIQGTNVLEYLQVPLHLPELEVNQNNLGDFVVVGYTLFAILTLLCLYFCAWTWWNRKLQVVKMAQPEFLLMIAAGCIVMSSAMVPLGFDDHSDSYTESQGKDFCMAFIWILPIGFTLVFSALFAKTWRINRVLLAAGQMQRVTVTKRNVALPFVMLLTGNVVTLTVWTVVNPRSYVRVDADGTDEWNRVIATYGRCKSADSDGPYLAVLGLLNGGLLLMSCYQAWRARHVKSELAESQYIAYAIAVGAQVSLIGLPMLFLSEGEPLLLYFTLVLIDFIVCAAVATLIFVPKIMAAKEFVAMDPADQTRRINNAVGRST